MVGIEKIEVCLMWAKAACRALWECFIASGVATVHGLNRANRTRDNRFAWFVGNETRFGSTYKRV